MIVQERWPSFEAMKRYYETEGFVVFEGICSNCETQIGCVAYPNAQTNLECPVCSEFAVNWIKE